MDRGRCYVLTAGVSLAMVSPALRGVDGFPLSTYPMFSGTGKPVTRIDTMLGVTTAGARETLNPELISGDRWPILAVELLEKAVRRKQPARRSLCERVAARVAADPERAGRISAVELVTERFDVRAYFAGEREPQERKVHFTCPVLRE
jgi:hypothetical protein